MIQPKNIIDQMRVQTLTDTIWEEMPATSMRTGLPAALLRGTLSANRIC